MASLVCSTMFLVSNNQIWRRLNKNCGKRWLCKNGKKTPFFVFIAVTMVTKWVNFFNDRMCPFILTKLKNLSFSLFFWILEYLVKDSLIKDLVTHLNFWVWKYKNSKLKRSTGLCNLIKSDGSLTSSEKTRALNIFSL